jgi:hypothetical protein
MDYPTDFEQYTSRGIAPEERWSVRDVDAVG